MRMLCLVALLVAGCRQQELQTDKAAAQDYAEARRAFRTKLVRQEPAPQPFDPLEIPPDAREIEFESAGNKLKGWISTRPKDATGRAPAVLFLHGGFAFAEEDWGMSKPF